MRGGKRDKRRAGEGRKGRLESRDCQRRETEQRWRGIEKPQREKGKNEERVERGKEEEMNFFFSLPCYFFLVFLVENPRFGNWTTRCLWLMEQKFVPKKASERVKQKKIVKETQDFFLCPPTVVISFLSPCVLRQIRKREAKTNCHRKRMIIIRRIELIFPTLQIN